jgi:hypothetical protein
LWLVVARGVALLEEWQELGAPLLVVAARLWSIVSFVGSNSCWVLSNLMWTFLFLAIVVWLASGSLLMTKPTCLSHGECKVRGFVGLSLLYTGSCTIFKWRCTLAQFEKKKTILSCGFIVLHTLNFLPYGFINTFIILLGLHMQLTNTTCTKKDVFKNIEVDELIFQWF